MIACRDVISPLRIYAVEVPKTGGMIGITECPGKNEYPVFGIPAGPWRRDVDEDLRVILVWRADILVSLIEDYEFELYNVSDLPAKAEMLGIRWLHLPIGDGCMPDCRFEKAWETAGKDLHRILAQGGRIVLHCRTGLGRADTIAARLLVEFGMTPREAFAAVRHARPDAISTGQEEAYVQRCGRELKI